MVASNFFGRANMVLTSVVFLDCSASFKVVFDKEKNATSEPETNAEIKSKTTSASIAMANDQSMLNNKNILAGSGSNIKWFS